MKKSILLLSGLLCFCLVVSGLTVASENASKEKEKAYDIGSKVKPFKLKDSKGKEHDLAKVLGKKIVLLDFWSSNCPVSRAYEERLKALKGKFGKKGVVIVAIDSNHNNPVDAIEKYVKKNQLNYPVLKDWKNVIADRFGALVTPHVFIIGKDKKIKYIGPIDDSQNPKKVKEKYADAALTALLAGEKVKVEKKVAIGCSIKRVK